MTERVIRITQEVYQSLPTLYQNIAEIGKQSGRIIIIDNRTAQNCMNKNMNNDPIYSIKKISDNNKLEKY
jgi:hypothetical protein